MEEIILAAGRHSNISIYSIILAYSVVKIIPGLVRILNAVAKKIEYIGGGEKN